MKKLIYILLALIPYMGFSQQLPMYSQYTLNNFLINPAITGSEAYTPIRLTARNQWADIPDAPRTQTLSAHTPIKPEKMGLGGYIFNDQFALIRQTGAQVSYAYHIQLSSNYTMLAFGVSASVFQMKLNNEKLKLTDNSDEVIMNTDMDKIIPDAGFGIYLYNGKYFVGLSSGQLLQSNVTFGEDYAMEDQLERQYFASAGYKFDLKNNLEIEPSLLFKANEYESYQADFNAKIYYKKFHWLGLSYRTNNDFIAMVGIKSKQFLLAYAFDYSLSKIADYASGTHEIMIGFNIGENKGSKLLD